MMQRRLLAPVGVIVAVAALVGALVTPTADASVPSVRGFDGTTIKVAGMGNVAHFPNAAVGAQARIKRFNDDNEIKGVKLDYTEYADVQQDPTLNLSEARRLVTQEQIFAVVGDFSQTNPGDYLNQQHVPYFGFGEDNTFCSTTPSTKLYGFGFNGCLVPENPKVAPDAGAALLEYAKQKTGNAHPTIALFSNDTQSGKDSLAPQASAYAGAGWDVTYAKSTLPPPPVSDYTPYAQPLLTAGKDGAAPDAIACLLSTDCIAMWSLLKASGFAGIYSSGLYSDAVLKPLQGSVVSSFTANLSDQNAGLDKMKQDIDAVKPGQVLDTSVVVSYLSTDMFIQALKTAAKKGKSGITPENVQAAAAKQTWQFKGVAGPTTYPQSTVKSYPFCNTVVEDTDGASWKTVVPFGCSKTSYPVLPKYKVG
jgi:ABC-type branched-subunit amino acid transport system substrate-binding protein